MSDLTTLANLKEWLALTNTTASDSLLSRLISAASAQIEKLTSRSFTLATYVETRNGMGGYRMILLNQPIVAIGSLMINGAPIPQRPNLSSYSPGLGGYTFDQACVYLSGCSFCPGAQNVVITYDAGYSTVPADIEQACIALCGNWFRYKDRIGKSSEGIEGQSISFSANMLSAGGVMDVINSNKRVFPVY
jgi:hypothetical protein